MPSTITHFEPENVEARLATMGLKEEQLLHAARRWYLTWSGFTLNHPPVGIGISAWTEAVAALREQVLPDGRTRSDERNYALAVSPDGLIAINVATGDGGTGRPNANPSNKAPKGTSTADAITVNQHQLDLDLRCRTFRISTAMMDHSPGSFFCTAPAPRSAVSFRCRRLCRPTAASRAGRNAFILSPIPIDDEVIEIEAPAGPDLDIEIKRKA
jgi:hypothetical protein